MLKYKMQFNWLPVETAEMPEYIVMGCLGAVARIISTDHV